MIYAWFMGRLPAEDGKGGYSRERFIADLEAPVASRRQEALADSGAESLTQFMIG